MLGQGLTIGVLGVALFTVAVVSGQTVSSLLLDHRGLARMPATPATPRRIVGAALAVAAVLVAVSDRLRVDSPLLVLLIPIAAGLLVGWQQAVNGQVRTVAGSALTATFGNFVVGTALLGIALVVHLAISGWPCRRGSPQLAGEWPAEWWLYVGGAVGCVFIAAQAVIVRTTGVLRDGAVPARRAAGGLGAARPVPAGAGSRHPSGHDPRNRAAVRRRPGRGVARPAARRELRGSSADPSP